MKIAVFAGDGIGPEVTAQALRVLDELSLPGLTLFEGDVGAVAYRRHGQPLPDETLEMARAADAVLFGAVGDFSCDDLPRHLRPEQAILGLRSELGLFANLRPAAGFPGLEHLSSLKPEIARSIDVLVVRELNGDVYFGDKGERASAGGREGWDAMSYNEAEVRRIAHTAFRAAMGRGKKLTSVDKANVLETSRIWRETVIEVARDYPDVTLDHMYVDNAAMQLVRDPRQFDVLLTGNLFGDILSDEAAMLTGSIGMLPSASLGSDGPGLFEPVHGSAPDIAGQDKANPMAMVLSAAMMLRIGLKQSAAAADLERAVDTVLASGLRTGDLMAEGCTPVGCSAMGRALIEAL